MLQINLPPNVETELLHYCQQKQIRIDQLIAEILAEYFADEGLSTNEKIAMALLEVAKARKGEIKLSTLDEFLEELKHEH